MSRKTALFLFITFIICLNGLIYLRASLTIEDVDLVFAECARNSGRTSAAINLTTLLFIGFYGLKSIYSTPPKRNSLRVLITLFAVNHLVHFYFVFQNFKSQIMELDISHNIHGFITFIFVLLIPVALWRIKKLNSLFYFTFILHLFNVTYFISDTFYGRVNPEDPAYLHRIGIWIMALSSLYIVYRMFKERNQKFSNSRIE